MQNVLEVARQIVLQIAKDSGVVAVVWLPETNNYWIQGHFGAGLNNTGEE